MTEQKYTAIQSTSKRYPLKARLKVDVEDDYYRTPYRYEYFDSFPYDMPAQWWPILYEKEDEVKWEKDCKYYCRTKSDGGQKYFIRQYQKIPLHMMISGFHYKQLSYFSIERDVYEDEKWFNKRTPMGHLGYYLQMRRKYRTITSRVVQRPYFPDSDSKKQQVPMEQCGLEVVLKMLALEHYAPLLCDHQVYDTHHFNHLGKNELNFFKWKPLEFRRLLRHLRHVQNQEQADHSSNQFVYAYFKHDQEDPEFKFRRASDRELYMVATEYEVGLLPRLWRKIGLTQFEKRSADDMSRREHLPTIAAVWKFWHMKNKRRNCRQRMAEYMLEWNMLDGVEQLDHCYIRFAN